MSKRKQHDSYIRGTLQAILSCGRSFCLHTTIHGFHHIAAAGRHWTERLLWVVITAGAVWGAVDISKGQLQRFSENPTVVTLEKDFRTWRYNLPALTVCDQDIVGFVGADINSSLAETLDKVNNVSLPKTIKALWNTEPSDPKYEYYAKFVATVANSDLYHLEGYEQFQQDPTLDVDLHQLVLQVMQELQVKTGSSEPITPVWTPVMTEAGICYTINSVAIADVAVKRLAENDTALFPYTCAYSAQGCYLILESNKDIEYYVHSPYDVADVATTPSNMFLSLSRFTELSSMETRAGRGVRELPSRRRGCLYTNEPASPLKQVYSTNTCRMSCRSRLTLKLCGCKPFYYFYEGFTAEEPMCRPSGMWCLSHFSHQLATFSGMKCPCRQQCVDSIYREVSVDDQTGLRGPFQNRGAVRMTVQAPRTRYTREIVFHFQDLVVSFGGAAGLFLGASFISFVEILYFFIERFFNINNNSKNHKKSVMPQMSRPYETRIQLLTDILAGKNENRLY